MILYKCYVFYLFLQPIIETFPPARSRIESTTKNLCLHTCFANPPARSRKGGNNSMTRLCHVFRSLDVFPVPVKVCFLVTSRLVSFVSFCYFRAPQTTPEHPQSLPIAYQERKEASQTCTFHILGHLDWPCCFDVVHFCLFDYPNCMSVCLLPACLSV